MLRIVKMIDIYAYNKVKPIIKYAYSHNDMMKIVIV